MRCETCKHRGKNVEQWVRKPTPEPYHYEPVPGEFWECLRIPHGERMPDHNGVRAYVNDASGYFARLYVKVDFFCAEYEE